MRLKSIDILNSTNRNSAVDFFRALAIVTVVIFHYNDSLPYGYLSIDIFFVISGLLVGGLLIKQLDQNKPIIFKEFFLMRCFKIIPSYLFFLFAGTLLAILFYRNLDPSEIITLKEWPKYLLFYKNYKFEPVHASFDQVWSLCVEEHFYLILPISYIILQRNKFDTKKLPYLLLATIAFGIILKLISFYFTRSGDTFFKTHNRIDALTWGVLLSVLIFRKIEFKKIPRISFAIIGIGLFLITVMMDIFLKYQFVHKILLTTLSPLSFALMIYGFYESDFSKLKPFRYIAYYSYNWYLWHAIFIKIIMHQFGINIFSFCLYFICSLLFAVIITILIEEPFLSLRKRVVKKSS